MAKEATNPNPSVQIEWYCLAAHKNTQECTLDYAGVKKQIVEKSDFIIFFLLSSFITVALVCLQEQWVWLAVVQTCRLNTCISHVSPSACTGCIRGAYGNPCQSIIWWLMIITARRSFYQTSWTCSCLDLPIMEAWLSFHDHINVCNSWHNIINGNRMKQQILLLRGVDSWSRSIVTAIMETQLSFLRMVIE